MAASAAARRVNAPASRVARRVPAKHSKRSAQAAPRSAGRRGATALRAKPRAAATRRRGITPSAGLLIPVAVGQRTATAVGGIADCGLILRLTRGRLWILLVGTLLVGIVALNVLSLSFSATASQVALEADKLERESSSLRAQLAMAVSSGEVEARAATLGLVVPEPGQVRYMEPLTTDAVVAAERLRGGELTAP